jgi:hypothetical protein
MRTIEKERDAECIAFCNDGDQRHTKERQKSASQGGCSLVLCLVFISGLATLITIGHWI